MISTQKSKITSCKEVKPHMSIFGTMTGNENQDNIQVVPLKEHK